MRDKRDIQLAGYARKIQRRELGSMFERSVKSSRGMTEDELMPVFRHTRDTEPQLSGRRLKRGDGMYGNGMR